MPGAALDTNAVSDLRGYSESGKMRCLTTLFPEDYRGQTRRLLPFRIASDA
jgi:hypothetical protein